MRRAAQLLCCVCALAFGLVLAGAASAPRAPNPEPRPTSPPASPPAAPAKPPVSPSQTPKSPPAPPTPPTVTVVEVQGGREAPTETTPTETTPTETTPTETTSTVETTDTTETTGSTETITFTASSPPPPPSDQPGSSSFTAQPARLALLAALILAESFVIVRLFRRDIRSVAIGITIAAVGAGLIVYGLGA